MIARIEMLKLSDNQMATLLQIAGGIPPQLRDAFLRNVDRALRNKPVDDNTTFMSVALGAARAIETRQVGSLAPHGNRRGKYWA
jgi:hypothetical protein